MQFDSLLISLFLGLILIGIGFIIGKITKTEIKYLDNRKSALTIEEMHHFWQAAQKEEKISEITDPIAEKISKQDDIVNNEGVGIIYRPTSEELARMNEDERIKQAKQELEKTFSQEVPPEI